MSFSNVGSGSSLFKNTSIKLMSAMDEGLYLTLKREIIYTDIHSKHYLTSTIETGQANANFSTPRTFNL